MILTEQEKNRIRTLHEIDNVGTSLNEFYDNLGFASRVEGMEDDEESVEENVTTGLNTPTEADDMGMAYDLDEEDNVDEELEQFEMEMMEDEMTAISDEQTADMNSK